MELYPVPELFKSRALIDKNGYNDMYRASIENNEAFWAEQAQRISWTKKFDKVKSVSFKKPVDIKWFLNGKLNIAYNCIDRHLPQHSKRVAFFWEPENPSVPARTITYQELFDSVNQLANLLKQNGVKKGDRVTIYLPMIPEAVYSVLACARIGAVHSVVFAGFSPHALAGRIQDCASEFLITADEGIRAGKTVPLKANVDEALALCPGVRRVLVIEHTKAKIQWNQNRDISYHGNIAKMSKSCPPEEMDSEDPLFILYTSGSTNKPKGLLHTTAGYLVYASFTHQYVFDHHQEDIYWCAADIGWVTGHSYIVYGPLSNGASSVLYEGVPNYPDASRIWRIVDKYKVNTLYTAPTLIRALMAEGEGAVRATKRSSLRLLGSVGEPINPEAWRWYHSIVGENRCPIVDTWWQTETGGILISPLPGATDLKAGSATFPLFGIQPSVVDDKGTELKGECSGALCLNDSWPGQARTIYGDHERFYQTYFSQFQGKYFTGDGCRRDADGYYWITGRIDDVLNVSGHRLGTAEIESALVAHQAVAEAAVVGYPHDIKGQGIYAYVTLNKTVAASDDLKKQLVLWVRKEISAIAAPDKIQFAPGLPKTRSGKIMRRILRKIAENNFKELGDTSTLADPKVVEDLIQNRQI